MKKLLIWILLFTVLISCRKSEQDMAARYPEVFFNIEKITPPSEDYGYSEWLCPEGEDGELPEPAYAEIIINGITYRPGVYLNNGELTTESIKPEGYQNEISLFNVTRFVLKAADGSITYASPEKNADYAGYVEKAVPFPIVIKGNSKTEIHVEVLCYSPDNQLNYGFEPAFEREIVVREKCFFGDVCVDPVDYNGSDYENQNTGLHVDMPALVEVVVKKNGVEVVNSPFTNASSELGWGVGHSLCVQYPDDLLVDGEVFTFELRVLVADGQGGFTYQLFHTFTAIDDGPLDVYDLANDGIIDFVLGNCVYSNPDDPTTDLQIPWDPLAIRNKTAYAFSATDAICFSDLPQISSKRGGWSNGPFQEDIKPHHLLMYADAPRCKISRATLVGSLTVSYQNGQATVNCKMVEGFTLNALYLYVGNEMLPRDTNGNFTVVPAQSAHTFPALLGTDALSHTFSGLSGDIYVVAHANVDGVFINE